MTWTPSADVDDELVARATALVPLLAENAERTESERQVVPEVMGAIEQAGLFEVIVPQRLGGLGSTMATQLAVAAELGRGCASSGWVQSLMNITTWAASRSPAAETLFAGDVRPRVAGVLAPSGTATPDGDGYRVTGRWPFASASFYATWFLGGVYTTDDTGNVTGVGVVAMPRADLEIEDTWFVAGMCGSTTDSPVAVAEIARAKLDIETAWLHAFDAASYIDGVGGGAERDPVAEARVRGQCGYLTSVLRGAVDGLANVGGAGSFASSSPLQRHWRDLNVGSRHAFLATSVSLETYGRALFGLDPIVLIL